MYCSTCGVAVAKGLNYCNYCGAQLNQGDGGQSQVRPESLIFAVLATFIFGLVAITVLIGVMKSVLDMPVERVLAFALLPFLTMLALEAVFIRLLLRRTRETKGASETPLLTQQTTKELDAAQPRVLPEPVPSVTEHTTRAFDPIYRDKL